MYLTCILMWRNPLHPLTLNRVNWLEQKMDRWMKLESFVFFPFTLNTVKENKTLSMLWNINFLFENVWEERLNKHKNSTFSLTLVTWIFFQIKGHVLF